MIRKYLLMTLGTILFALGFDLFLQPSGIAPGGLSGIALLINNFIPVIPIGVLTLCFNIPLFFLGLKKLGGAFVRNTIFTTITLSLLLDAFAYLPALTAEPLLSAIYGGLMLGSGMGLAFRANSSTGGIDIAVRVLQQKYPHLSIGQIMLCFDTLVALSAAIVFRNIDHTLYAIITMYVSSLVLDAILSGQIFAKTAYIITSDTAAIGHEISQKLERGITYIPCTGGYSGEKRSMILCAIKRSQITSLKQIVRAIDPNAFVILCDAREVLGLGFQSHDKKTL